MIPRTSWRGVARLVTLAFLVSLGLFAQTGLALQDGKAPLDGLPELGGRFTARFNAAVCDGSVRPMTSNVNPRHFRTAITPAGGEDFDWGNLSP